MARVRITDSLANLDTLKTLYNLKAPEPVALLGPLLPHRAVLYCCTGMATRWSVGVRNEVKRRCVTVTSGYGSTDAIYPSQAHETRNLRATSQRSTRKRERNNPKTQEMCFDRIHRLDNIFREKKVTMRTLPPMMPPAAWWTGRPTPLLSLCTPRGSSHCRTIRKCVTSDCLRAHGRFAGGPTL